MFDDRFTCNGTSIERCGETPDKTGRFILSTSPDSLWVLCQKHAADFTMNIQISLNCGSREITYDQALTHVMMD